MARHASNEGEGGCVFANVIGSRKIWADLLSADTTKK